MFASFSKINFSLFLNAKKKNLKHKEWQEIPKNQENKGFVQDIIKEFKKEKNYNKKNKNFKFYFNQTDEVFSNFLTNNINISFMPIFLYSTKLNNNNSVPQANTPSEKEISPFCGIIEMGIRIGKFSFNIDVDSNNGNKFSWDLLNFEYSTDSLIFGKDQRIENILEVFNDVNSLGFEKIILNSQIGKNVFNRTLSSFLFFKKIESLNFTIFIGGFTDPDIQQIFNLNDQNKKHDSIEIERGILIGASKKIKSFLKSNPSFVFTFFLGRTHRVFLLKIYSNNWEVSWSPVVTNDLKEALNFQFSINLFYFILAYFFEKNFLKLSEIFAFNLFFYFLKGNDFLSGISIRIKWLMIYFIWNSKDKEYTLHFCFLGPEINLEKEWNKSVPKILYKNLGNSNLKTLKEEVII